MRNPIILPVLILSVISLGFSTSVAASRQSELRAEMKAKYEKMKKEMSPKHDEMKAKLEKHQERMNIHHKEMRGLMERKDEMLGYGSDTDSD